MEIPIVSGLTSMYPDFDGEEPFTPVIVLPAPSDASSLIEGFVAPPPSPGKTTMLVVRHRIGGRLPKYQGDVWTGGGFNELYLNLIALATPPHTELFTFGRMTYGTFAGSKPFAVVYPTSGEIQRTERFEMTSNSFTARDAFTVELAKHYPGLAYWKILVCFASPFFTMVGYFDVLHTCFVIERLFWGDARYVAQKDHLFPFEELPLSTVCWLAAGVIFDEGAPLPSFLFRLYHEAVVRTTVTPKHLTTYPKKSILKITATPYPYHKMTRFVIRSVITMPSFTTAAETDGWVVRDPEGTVTITVPIADEYTTTDFVLGNDIFTASEMLRAWTADEEIGQVIGNTYVVAESTYTGTEPLPAGSPISIQCLTNECCAPTWAIEETDAPDSWGLSIDSDGLITGYIPRNETLGTYYITVSVTGPTQTVEATVYIEVTAPLIYGNVWVGKAKLGTGVTGLAEVGDNIFACTYDGKIFYAAKTDLTSWTEASYTGTPQRFAGIAKMTDTLLIAVEMQYTGVGSGHAYCWKSTDAGLNWVKISTQMSYGNGGLGQVWTVDSSTFLWSASYRGTATETSIVAGTLFDPVTEAIVDTVNLPNTSYTGFPGNMESEFCYAGGTLVYCTHAANVCKIYSCSGISALGFPAATLTYIGTYGTLNNANPLVNRDGEFTFAPNTYGGSAIQTSADGTTWTPTIITLSDTFRLYVLSPKAPGVVQLRTKYSAATLYRTTDRWASGAGTEVLASMGAMTNTTYPILEIELTGVLVLGCAGATSNIFTSEE